MSAGNTARNDALFLDNLGRFARGEPLTNEADPKDVLAVDKSGDDMTVYVY